MNEFQDKGFYKFRIKVVGKDQSIEIHYRDRLLSAPDELKEFKSELKKYFSDENTTEISFDIKYLGVHHDYNLWG